MTRVTKPALLALSMLAGVCFTATPSQAATCIGNCGKVESGFTGSVTAAPTNFGAYDWVSTSGGQSGAAKLPGTFSSGSTTGSELISDAFFGAAGQEVSFWFNYITSDGAGFADYGFAQLINTTTNDVINLFTARTLASGTIVPGTNMPVVEATLSPATVPIKPGAPVWAPLGGSSGTCYASGCGYTGWVESTYTLEASGSYQLRFGTANWSDSQYQSGLAFSGLVIDGAVIGDGSSVGNPLLPGEIDPDTGAFEFEFVATPATVWIDPEYAVGYTYEVQEGPSILKAFLPAIPGDPDGYQVFLLSDLVNPFAILTAAGGEVDFTSIGGVLGFKVLGIDLGLLVNAPDAFVTGIQFNIAAGQEVTIKMTQTPITVFVADGVPEPSTWAMMIGGFALAGAAMRRRKTAVSFA
jgi:hypothetical protein